ncbi:superoxide dismutase family protein [Aurantiacibacter poecillastricola]|uniref:superoxide dismutase family protein n=1 Tax=Aurantiacibacter poecillastricola TaxID=3064385 RepID=UPI00273DE037|nr:superoxide dismutase family protein [Aurantiacibacter sp. 219JJ12-13]MDP5260321.1 superoxide dismutase family protein [Aurantiacibacter sp. 219JJ12-13]
MQRLALPIASLALFAVAGCATAYEDSSDQVGSATLSDRSGNDVGMARLYAQDGEVTVSVDFTGLSAGTHAVHLHMTGDCSAPDFTSAGGHLNPSGNEHGTLNPQGAHLGDLPNVEISTAGMGTMSHTLSGQSTMVLPQIFDADGTALVVHEGADDYRTDPAGAAGSRVACGVFSRM